MGQIYQFLLHYIQVVRKPVSETGGISFLPWNMQQHHTEQCLYVQKISDPTITLGILKSLLISNCVNPFRATWKSSGGKQGSFQGERTHLKGKHCIKSRTVICEADLSHLSSSTLTLFLFVHQMSTARNGHGSLCKKAAASTLSF